MDCRDGPDSRRDAEKLRPNRTQKRERRHPLAGAAPLKPIEIASVIPQAGRSHSSRRGVNTETLVSVDGIARAQDGPTRGVECWWMKSRGPCNRRRDRGLPTWRQRSGAPMGQGRSAKPTLRRLQRPWRPGNAFRPHRHSPGALEAVHELLRALNDVADGSPRDGCRPPSPAGSRPASCRPCPSSHPRSRGTVGAISPSITSRRWPVSAARLSATLSARLDGSGSSRSRSAAFAPSATTRTWSASPRLPGSRGSQCGDPRWGRGWAQNPALHEIPIFLTREEGAGLSPFGREHDGGRDRGQDKMCSKSFAKRYLRRIEVAPFV